MDKQRISRIAKDYLIIIIGTVFYAAGFQFFTYPNAIVPGGVSGIAMIINMLTELPVGMLTIIMNIPLFIVAWKEFGTKLLVGSLVGMLLSSVLVDLFALIPLVVTNEPLLASIYGGIIKGFGLGLVFYGGGTTGGIDIAAKLIRKKRPYINLGTAILIMDIVVVGAFAVIFRRYDSAMYALIAMFMSTKTMDLVLTGAVNSKVCYIITDVSEEVKDAITMQLHRGVTMLHGMGAYSHVEKEVILCVIKRQQIVELKKILQELDPKAFMIVSDSREVFGKGFGSIYES